MTFRLMDDVSTIIFKIKLSYGCNLRCRYCYDRRNVYSRDDTFTKANLLRIFNLVSDYMELHCDKSIDVNFVWHGGEPLIYPASDLGDVLSICDETFGRKGFATSHGIQTNGTLMDEDVMEILRRNNVRAGISYDYGSDYRITVDGKPVGERVLEVIKELRQEGLDFDVINTISKENVGKAEALYSFYRDLGVNFRLCHQRCPQGNDGGVRPPEPGEYGEMLLTLARLWLDEDPCAPMHVYDIELAAENLILGDAGSSMCINCRNCVYNQFMIDSYGTVKHCDLSDLSFGNVFKDNFDDILYHHKRLDLLRNRVRDVAKKCRGCKWLRQCWGGCTCGDPGFNETHCVSTKMLYSFLNEHREQVNQKLSAATQPRRS